MCGRVKMVSDYSELKLQFDIDDDQPTPNTEDAPNAPPTSRLPVLRLDDRRKRVIEAMTWGLRPSWAKDPKTLGATFNARAETVHEKPTFRGAWRAGRRCLVLVDAFYEWQRHEGKEKLPYAIAHDDRRTMAMAGLYEIWVDKQPGELTGEVIKTFTIITTAANAQVGKLHDRMPVILDKEQWSAWLGEVPATEAELKAMLAPYGGALDIWPVHPRMGSVKYKRSDVADPLPPIQ